MFFAPAVSFAPKKVRAVDGGDDQHSGPIGDHLVGGWVGCHRLRTGGRPRNIGRLEAPTSRRCRRRSALGGSGSA